jgi:hypothetical protein
MERCCYSPISFQGFPCNRASIITYSDFHALPGDELHAAHNILLHLDELRQLLGEIGAEGTGGILTEGMSYS